MNHFMRRLRTACLAVATMICAGSTFAETTDAPAVGDPMLRGMSLYVAPTLRLTMSYPQGFVPRLPETLEAALQREHLSAPENAPMACMHTLFHATRSVEAAGSEGTSSSGGESAPETILLEDIDRSCLAGPMSGVRIGKGHRLAMLANTLLRMPGVIPLVAATLQRVDGHHIHAGMSSGMMIVDGAVPGSDDAAFGRQAPVYVVAASFEQQQHWLLVCYLSGTRGEQARQVGRMSVSFDGLQPVRLFPFFGEKAMRAE